MQRAATKTDNGSPSGQWIEFEDLEQPTRTPMGQVLVDDLELVVVNPAHPNFQPTGLATLRIDRLRLTAFQPGSRPGPLADCEPVVDDRVTVEWEEFDDEPGGYWSTTISGYPLQEPGEPLEDLSDMTPVQVEAVLQDLGLCYVFNHSWKPFPQFEDERLDAELEGYWDRRCSAPSTGEVVQIDFAPDHASGRPDPIVRVEVRETEPRPWPEPPSYGTGCSSR